jgi:GWxTD domain-containing protein
MKRVPFLCSVLLMLTVLYNCSTPSNTRNSKSAANNKFTNETYTIRPEFAVFNVSEKESEMYFKIANKELLYTRPDGINFYSNVLISFRLFKNYESKDILDSASTRIMDLNNESVNKFLIGKLTIKTPLYKRYVLRITVTDLNRNVTSTHLLPFEKETDLGRNNFMIKNFQEDVPLFSNYVKPNQKINIAYKSKLSVALNVRYYKRDFPLAAPAFSSVDPKPFLYKADSVFTLQLDKDGKTDFTFPQKGFYHFQLDTSRKEGLTLFCFSDYFPEIKTAEDMIPSLRFITSFEEYNELLSSNNKRQSVEKFWLNCSGNLDKAKELIKRYYNRMQDANYYFTSYLEGWKTDRGMVYLIYGKPSTIYRKPNAETWIYGDESNINSLYFTFNKVNNPFTENDFSLERSTTYKQSWYIAVDNWRQGRVNGQD